MRRVVSLTPMAADRDSRTFKQAASMARMGFESVLVEDQESRLERGRLPLPADVGTGPTRSAPRLARMLAQFANQHVPELYRTVLRLWHYGPVTARSVPPASLYYLHSPLQYPAMLLRDRRTPFVYDAHDFYAADRTDELWDRLLTWLERRCVRNAAEVVTVTEGCAGLIEDFFGRRPVVVPNVHDPRIDEPPPEDLRTALGLGAEDFLIVMVGNAKPGTAVEEALAALAELPERVTWRSSAAAGTPTPGAWPSSAWPARPSARGRSARPDRAADRDRGRVGDPLLPADPGLPSRAAQPAVPPDLGRAPADLSRGAGGDAEAGRALRARHRLRPLREPASLVAAVGRLLSEDGALAEYSENARRAAGELTWEQQEPRLKAIIEASMNGAGVFAARAAAAHRAPPIETARDARPRQRSCARAASAAAPIAALPAGRAAGQAPASSTSSTSATKPRYV